MGGEANNGRAFRGSGVHDHNSLERSQRPRGGHPVIAVIGGTRLWRCELVYSRSFGVWCLRIRSSQNVKMRGAEDQCIRSGSYSKY